MFNIYIYAYASLFVLFYNRYKSNLQIFVLNTVFEGFNHVKINKTLEIYSKKRYFSSY